MLIGTTLILITFIANRCSNNAVPPDHSSVTNHWYNDAIILPVSH